MGNEFEPCPFCGGTRIEYHERKDMYRHCLCIKVMCWQCLASTKEIMTDTLDEAGVVKAATEARRRWNMRP